MDDTLGERIRRLREAQGWQQDELAQKMDLSRETLSSIENNRRHIKAEELGRFADVLGVSSDQLLGRIALDKVNLEMVYPKEKAREAMRINVPSKNVQKFKEVLLYILNKIGAKPNIGETVLYKLLYFIDFDFYEKYEDDMISNKEIEKVKSSFYQKEQKKYLPLRAACLDFFSAKEMKLIDEVLNRLGDKNASQISEYSHGDIPWKVTENMETIDYETVFYRTPEYSVRSAENE